MDGGENHVFGLNHEAKIISSYGDNALNVYFKSLLFFPCISFDMRSDDSLTIHDPGWLHRKP